MGSLAEQSEQEFRSGAGTRCDGCGGPDGSSGRSNRASKTIDRTQGAVKWIVPMADRTFTLDEAQSLLPVLESLLRAAMDAKKILDEADTEQQALQHRIFLNGGMFLKIVPLARRKAERAKA